MWIVLTNYVARLKATRLHLFRNPEKPHYETVRDGDKNHWMNGREK